MTSQRNHSNAFQGYSKLLGLTQILRETAHNLESRFAADVVVHLLAQDDCSVIPIPIINGAPNQTV